MMLRRQSEALQEAHHRIRRPALALAAAGVMQIVLAVVAGIVPPLVIGGLVAWSGSGDALMALGVSGGISLFSVVISVAGGLVIAAAGASMIRLRSRVMALVGVLIAFPVAVVCASIQFLFVPVVGILSGGVCVIFTLIASIFALMALQDPRVDVAFDVRDED